MEKKIVIKKNGYVLFFVNIVILLSLLLFRTYFLSVGYHAGLVNIMLMVNLLVLIVGIIFNVLIIKNERSYDENKSIKIVITCFVIYILINTLGVYLLNKPLDKGYTKISEMLSSYCDSYGCDKYETVKSGFYEEFVIKKTYFDYNNVQNSIDIHTKYNSKQVISVTSVIYSEKNMFSENLIGEQLSGYYKNFGCEISDEKIREAFENRFNGEIKDNNVIYQVSEIYKDEQLDKLRTKITLTLEKK